MLVNEIKQRPCISPIRTSKTHLGNATKILSVKRLAGVASEVNLSKNAHVRSQLSRSSNKHTMIITHFCLEHKSMVYVFSDFAISVVIQK